MSDLSDSIDELKHLSGELNACLERQDEIFTNLIKSLEDYDKWLKEQIEKLNG